jgi:hypothetical protein
MAVQQLPKLPAARNCNLDTVTLTAANRAVVGKSPDASACEVAADNISADARRRLANANVPSPLSGEPDRSVLWPTIDNATAVNATQIAKTAYRKALRADCTCNGHNPSGLVPVDLGLDDSLRPDHKVSFGDTRLIKLGHTCSVPSRYHLC